MQINVTVEQVDLTSIVGVDRTDIGYGDYIEEPQTLADVVADRIAADLKQTDDYQSLRERVTDMRLEEIREQLRPIVAAAIAAPIQKTNGYGAPVGEPTSLTELVVTEVRNVLDRRDAYDRNAPTFVQKVIREEVTRVLQKELGDAIAAEKAKVIAAVRAQAAQLIADAVKQGIGG